MRVGWGKGRDQLWPYVCSDNPHSFTGESQILTSNRNRYYHAYVSFLVSGSQHGSAFFRQPRNCGLYVARCHRELSNNMSSCSHEVSHINLICLYSGKDVKVNRPQPPVNKSSESHELIKS